MLYFCKSLVITILLIHGTTAWADYYLYKAQPEQNIKLNSLLASGVILKSVVSSGIEIGVAYATGIPEVYAGTILYAAVTSVLNYKITASGIMALSARYKRNKSLGHFREEPALQSIFAYTGEVQSGGVVLPYKTYRTIIVGDFLEGAEPDPEQWMHLGNPETVAIQFQLQSKREFKTIANYRITLKDLIEGKLVDLDSHIIWMADQTPYDDYSVQAKISILDKSIELGTIANGKDAARFLDASQFQKIRSKILGLPAVKVITTKKIKIEPSEKGLWPRLISFCEYLAGGRI